MVDADSLISCAMMIFEALLNPPVSLRPHPSTFGRILPFKPFNVRNLTRTTSPRSILPTILNTPFDLPGCEATSDHARNRIGSGKLWVWHCRACCLLICCSNSSNFVMLSLSCMRMPAHMVPALCTLAARCCRLTWSKRSAFCSPMKYQRFLSLQRFSVPGTGSAISPNPCCVDKPDSRRPARIIISLNVSIDRLIQPVPLSTTSRIFSSAADYCHNTLCPPPVPTDRSGQGMPRYTPSGSC